MPGNDYDARSRFAYVALALITATRAAAQAASRHPLDPLSAAEITRAVSVMRDAGRVTPETRFGTITVQPRSKSGEDHRAARVLGFDWSRNQGFVAVVDLVASRVESWVVVDSEPPMRLLTIRRAEEIAHADPRWVAAMQKRKIDTSRVSVLVGLPERAKLPRKGTDRVVNAFVWLRDGVPQDYTVPGLGLEVNLTRGRLESITDDSRAAPADSSPTMKELARTRAALAPLRVSQPNGSAARITDNVITWDKWRFRVGVDPRRGLEVHDVSFGAGPTRSVLSSGSISEIFAPYGDSSFGAWYPRDEGDYGMGIYSQSSGASGWFRRRSLVATRRSMFPRRFLEVILSPTSLALLRVNAAKDLLVRSPIPRQRFAATMRCTRSDTRPIAS